MLGNGVFSGWVRFGKLGRGWVMLMFGEVGGVRVRMGDVVVR